MIQAAELFQNNMVLQAGKPVPVWGRACPGERIVAEIQNKTAETTADEEGAWQVILPALSVSEEETLTLSAGSEKTVFDGVAVGEVWLAGGQSNMEFPVAFEMHREEILRNCRNGRIRFWDMPEVSYDGQREQFDYSTVGIWRKAGSEDIDYFSAVGYFFEKKLEKELNVPVGIIGCNWGGTPAAAWMPQEVVEGAGKIWMDEFREKMGKYENPEKYYELQRASRLNDSSHLIANPINQFLLPRTPPMEEFVPFMGEQYAKGNIAFDPDALLPYVIPGALYEHMLKGLAPYAIRGFIWYQGETDEPHAEIYDVMLKALINAWRELWKEKLPFIEVQLPGFESWLGVAGHEAYPLLRRMQKKAADETPDVWMVSISDAGQRDDIHPKDKKRPGERLALMALGKVYGRDLLCEAPEPEAVTTDGNEIRIRFKNADGGLTLVPYESGAAGTEVNGLVVIPEQKYSCRIEGEELILAFEEAPLPENRIEFAQTPYYKVNLYNRSGIPAIPFGWDMKEGTLHF